MKIMDVKMERQSPVRLQGQVQNKTLRDHWPIVLEYADEGPGPWLVDMSHWARWDVQGDGLSRPLPAGLSFPSAPGGVALTEGALIGRSGSKQGFLWGWEANPASGLEAGYTETTEATACLGLLGKEVLRIAEKLTVLDLGDPERKAPFLLQGPFAHVTSQVLVLSNDPPREAVLISFSRGFAHDMVHALLSAGEEYGLRPAGENRFREVFSSLI